MPNDYTPAKRGKWLQRMLDNPAPRILIEHGKHGVLYYHATGEALLSACLDVIKWRVKNGYLPTVEQAEASLAKALADPEYLSQEQIDALPAGSVKDFAIKEQKWAARYRDQCRDAVEQAKRAALAIEHGDGAAAYYIMQERGEYEYENFKIETLIIPE